MGASTIEWTEHTWNPVSGCDRVSPGCDHCYAETIANRFAGTKAFPDGFKVTLHPERLAVPLKRKQPTTYFVNSMSDLFHQDIPDLFIAQVFAVMSQAPQHTFQVLTKRPQRMAHLVGHHGFIEGVQAAIDALYDDPDDQHMQRGPWPLSNVWLGVSVENQRYADLRIPHLLATPAAVRFLSVEPMLGPVDLSEWLPILPDDPGGDHGWWPEPWLHPDEHPPLHWVICGGESGPGARPMSPWWARQLRDQCTAVGASVPFFFKQWGEHAPAVDVDPDVIERKTEVFVDQEYVVKVGKKAAGRLLDGRTWDETPEARQ